MQRLFEMPLRFFHPERLNRRLTTSLLIGCLMLSASGQALAAGAPAGATVTNTATVNYQTAGVPLQRSATANFQVDERIDLDLTSLEIAPRNVSPGSSDSPLAFRLTNSGNGKETFQLSLENLLAGNDFNPVASTPTSIYLDDGDENFNPSADTVYTSGVNDPTLDADTNLVIFILNDIPGSANDGETGSSQLTATATTGSGPAWTVLGANTGDNNTTAILGNSGGAAQASGTYLINDLYLTLDKAYTIVDPEGTNDPIPGAVITYRIEASIAGSGTLNNIVITDLIPARTTFVPGSIKLNNMPLTDGPSDDAGDFDQTTANTVTVLLGNMSSASASQTIEFQVSID